MVSGISWDDRDGLFHRSREETYKGGGREDVRESKFIWFISFIWLNQTRETKQTKQTT